MPQAVFFMPSFSVFICGMVKKRKKKKSVTHKARPGFTIPIIFTVLNCIQICLGIKQIYMSPSEVYLTNELFLT